MDKPAGATIVSDKTTNEAGAKLSKTKKSASFEEFLATMKKKEQESLKPLSGDLETLTNVSQKDLMELQGRFENGTVNPEGQNRLQGWDDKTRTALVLKVAFIDKKKANGK